MSNSDWEKDLAEAQRRILARLREREKEIDERQTVEELAKGLGLSTDDLLEEIEAVRRERIKSSSSLEDLIPVWIVLGTLFVCLIIGLVGAFAR